MREVRVVVLVKLVGLLVTCFEKVLVDIHALIDVKEELYFGLLREVIDVDMLEF